MEDSEQQQGRVSWPAEREMGDGVVGWLELGRGGGHMPFPTAG